MSRGVKRGTYRGKPSSAVLLRALVMSVDRQGEWFKIPCLSIPGAKDKDGYTKVHFQDKTMKASRVAYYLYNGEWPIQALHKCDNPACVNPLHLWNGTQKDNIQDAWSKGRSRQQREKRRSDAAAV